MNNLVNDEYNELIKIDIKKLEEINSDEAILNNFGNWVNDIENLNDLFKNALPFEHIVIDNFLDEKYANELYNLFPEKFDDWHKYENPIEYKFTYDDIEKLDLKMKNYFYYLSSDKLINIFRKITNIDNLTYDEYLHGAGLHCHPKYGKLNVHLDYEKHPFSGKERRLNIIYFLSKNWDNSWNGHNELWDKEAISCVKKTDVKFNRAIIFKTNDISWHGLSETIQCPENQYRKSLAFYYLSPLISMKNENNYRKKAKYIITNEKEKNNKALLNLCEIRSNRRLNNNDIIEYNFYTKKNL
jgi:Rps23 Pro-64 3,4-dihydroxylase Tpa1-like proline 4-hydroxylase